MTMNSGLTLYLKPCSKYYTQGRHLRGWGGVAPPPPQGKRKKKNRKKKKKKEKKKRKKERKKEGNYRNNVKLLHIHYIT